MPAIKLSYINSKYFIAIILSGVFSNPCWAANYVYEYDSYCAKAYEQYMSLHIADGDMALKQAIIHNPYNLMCAYLADYNDYLTLLLNGNKADLEQRNDHMDERLSLLANGDEKSPWYKLCRAGIYLHWAIIHLRFGDNFKAALQFRHSFLLLKENQKKFPDFRYNDFFFGLEEAVVGSVPDDYKWIASLFGLKGSIRDGVERMGSFADKHAANDIFQPEAVVFYSFTRYYLMYKQEEVWKYVNSEQVSTRNNLMYTFLRGNMALNYRKGDVAAETFKEATIIKDYNNFPLFEYQLGCAQFLKLDPACIDHFKNFINKYYGKLYVKDALYKLTLSYYLLQNMQQANYYRGQISRQGNTMVDVDKTAQRFSQHEGWPNSNLLRAHLLIDGGYYKQALDILNAINESTLITTTDKLEYSFRLARVYDEDGSKDKALAYYQKTINAGRNERDYFAARSALQMAFIYEKAGDTKNALARYNECLSIRHHDFQNAIDQQAKAGINRLTVK